MMLPHATSTAPVPATAAATAPGSRTPSWVGTAFADALGAATSQATDGGVASSQSPDEEVAGEGPSSAEGPVAEGGGPAVTVDAALSPERWTSWVFWSLLNAPADDTSGEGDGPAPGETQVSPAEGRAVALAPALVGSPAIDIGLSHSGSSPVAIVAAMTPATPAEGDSVPLVEPTRTRSTPGATEEPGVSAAVHAPTAAVRREALPADAGPASVETLGPSGDESERPAPRVAGARAPSTPAAPGAANAQATASPSTPGPSDAPLPADASPAADHPAPVRQRGEAEPPPVGSAAVVGAAVATDVVVAPKSDPGVPAAEPVLTAVPNAPVRAPTDPVTPAVVDAVPTARADTADAVLDQVVRSLRLQWKNGLGEARILLRPEHLGPVNISLKVDGGAVTAVVRAESAQVQEWILSHQQTLRQQLEAAGLTLDGLVVSPDGDRRRQGGAEARAQQRALSRRRRDDEDTTLPRFEVVV